MGVRINLDRRRGEDRRRKPTRWMSIYWLRGKRRGDRRKWNQKNQYVDRYGRVEWGLALGILFLCVCDLVLTLRYLAEGGEEANPLMAMSLEQGPGLFVSLKLGITLFGVFFLLQHVRFGRVRILMSVLFSLYVVLNFYHVYLRLHPFL